MGNHYLKENVDQPYEPEFWIPLRWASRLLNKSQKCGLIYDLRTTSTLIVVIFNLLISLVDLILNNYLVSYLRFSLNKLKRTENL